ncbi:homocysteine S-methyltransferase family protein [Mycolicibacterium lacusdiani]|uniref:homocysteine S-methyltransferase family protein n=1 Tax=Mycolicibacterium lacusdiani TaxID=2895283 RepID=UPI001F1FD2F0|nr:homocysteine S-methyltransferase family protein [Mycolicibacterium lacusdiani]
MFVTDGGIETDLMFRRGVNLPHFAAFVLLDTAEGRSALRDYYAGYAAIASAGGHPLLLESPTWRANPDWGRLLGYDAGDLERVNSAAIEFMAELRRDHVDAIGHILVSGSIGPRHDGYAASSEPHPDAAFDYHRPQLAAFAAASADLATAYTITHVGEAIGIVLAARAERLPIAVSFTVDADGRLLSGIGLAEAITTVDEAAPPDYFLVNCAHPSHIATAVGPEQADWNRRIAGIRANASTAGHADLDAAIERDDGTPREFAAAQAELLDRLPHLSILGGCCGTDERHIGAMVRETSHRSSESTPGEPTTEDRS